MKKVILMMQMLLAFCSVAQVQTQKIDSLQRVIKNHPRDNRILANSYLEIADYYSHSHPDSIKRNCYLALNHLKGLKEDTMIVRIKADVYTNLGLSYSMQGKLIDALNCHTTAKPLWEKIRDPEGLTQCYNNIAVINKQAFNFEEAEKQFKNALSWAAKVKEQNYKAMILNNLGNLYKEQRKDDLALKCYMRSKLIRAKLNEPDGIAATFNNIGSLYQKQGKYSESIIYFTKALKLVEQTNNMRGIAHATGNLGTSYFKIGQNDQALKYALLSLEKGQEIHAENVIAEASDLLAKIYTKKQDWKKAVEMHQLHLQFTNPKKLEDLSRELIKSEFEFDFEKRQGELEFRTAKNLITANEQKQKQTLVIAFISILVVILLIFSFLLYKRIVHLNAQKKLIEKQSNERKLLLQEIHHRVKNNFQIISSMLRLQSVNQNNKEVNEAFQEAINRLYAMSFVHELTYKNNSFQEIELKEYLEKLMGSIKKSFPLNMIEITHNGVEERLNIERAIPIGIVLNELITNSFKHAFPEFKEDAKIHIEIEKKENQFILIYQDNGIGYDPDKSEHSFGTELIHTIVDQLTGKIHYSQDKQWNTQVSMSFEG